MIPLLFLACDSAPADSAAPPAFVLPAAPATALVPLPAPRLLRRMSLDLRGVLPSTDELAAVVADPAALDTYRDTWLDDPRLEERLVRLLAESWHTRIDDMPLSASDYGLAPTDEYTLARAAGEEPLRLMAHVVVEDRPWTDVVTADFTMANPLLASIWPVQLPTGATGWAEAHYIDGRPALGVLATNGLWWRYSTNLFNFNRGRAAAAIRLLLCDDLLARPVATVATPSLVDADGTQLATRSQADCLACHLSMDPLAASLFGFWPYDRYDPLELDHYHPEREPLGADFLGVEPAAFGVPLAAPAALGPALAADPRLAQCAVRTFAEAMWRRPVEWSDSDTIEALRRDFVAGGERVKPLLRALVESDAYRAGSVAEGADIATEARERTTRSLSPDQLESVLFDATGFRWIQDGYAQLDNDTVGYRVMAGGVDGLLATRPGWDPSLSFVLVTDVAARGAGDVVGAAAVAGGAGLLPGVTAETTADGPEFLAAVDALHWRLFATAPDAAWEADQASLWRAVAESDGAAAAWSAVLQVNLRDPDFLSL